MNLIDINPPISPSPEIGLAGYPPIFEEIFLRNLSHEIIVSFKRLNNTKIVHLVDFEEIETLKNSWKLSLRDGVYGIQHPLGAIEVKFSSKAELNTEYDSILSEEGHLVVETYRLDGNALPGNELWLGKVRKNFGDPSYDVRHTAIPFIHNPLVNTKRLCGRNLRIYGGFNGGVFDWNKMFLWFRK